MSSADEEGGTPRAVRARRREEEGRIGGEAEVVKREKASRISDSVWAVMLCSFASLERGCFLVSVVEDAAGGRRLGGFAIVN